MTVTDTELRLRGRRDQGNQQYRRIHQLQALEQRSGGAFTYIAYDKRTNLYHVQVAGQPVMQLRSRDIDAFVTGMESGVLAMGAPGGHAEAFYRQTSEQRVARLEPARVLADPVPTAALATTGDPAHDEVRVQWEPVPDADRYVVELRDTSLRNPMWREAAACAEPHCAVPVRSGSGWQVRVRAEDTTGQQAISDWAVADAHPTQG